MSVLATNVEVEVYINGSIKFKTKYGEQWDKDPNTSKGKLMFRNLVAGFGVNGMADLEIPKIESSNEILQIATGILSCNSEGRSYTVTHELRLKVTNDDDLGEAYSKVEEELTKSKAVKLTEDVQLKVEKK